VLKNIIRLYPEKMSNLKFEPILSSFITLVVVVAVVVIVVVVVVAVRALEG
jgi:hypothetical protein